MLKIYSFSLETIREIRPLIDIVARKDSDLAKQARRATSSIALNIAEGSYAQGRNAKSRFYTAMASANEVRACFDVADAFGYIDFEKTKQVRASLERIIATLYKLTR